MKKITAVVLSIVVSLVLLIGCSKEMLPEPGPKDVIYKFSDFTPEGFNYDVLVGLDFYADTIYMLTQKIELREDGKVESFYLLKIDSSGKVIEKELLSSATEEQMADIGYKYYMGVSVGNHGEIYLVQQTALNKARLKSDYSWFSTNDGLIDDPFETKTEEGDIEPNTKTEIVHRSSGTETVLVDLTSTLVPFVTDTANMFVSDFEVDKEGFAYVMVNANMVYAFNLSKNEILFKNKPIPLGGDIRGLYKNKEGEICIVSFKQMEENGEKINKLIIDPINPKSGNFGKEERVDAPSGNYSNLASGDDKYTYYGFSSSSIYGYKNGNRILVADLPASGVNLSEITRVIPVSDTQFLIAGYTLEETGLEKLYMLTKVAPEDVPDKSIIKVAAVAEPIYFQDYIKEFMLTHPQYQVEYKQYAVDSNASYEDALTEFNNDLIAGNIPDVIVIEPEMPYGNYVRKGMLADLYPFIDNDLYYSREDFLKPILKAFETDGKLYSIAPAFDFDTLVGKTEIFGEKQGQSFAELEAAAAKIPGTSLFGTGVDRDIFVAEILTRAAKGFVDNEKGVCSFNSEEFISLLEYAKSLPPSTSLNEINSAQRETSGNVGKAAEALSELALNFAPGETTDYRTDRTLIEVVNVWDFRHIVSLEKMEFGESVTFLGFPNNSSSGGSGIFARARLETAIMNKAENPDGAWDFIKGLFSYGSHWIKIRSYPLMVNFPTLMSEIAIAAERTTLPAYETWYGERMPRINWLGADLSNQPNNTQADNAKIFALFESIEGIERTIPAIENIISEETAAFFAGNKSAEETAAIIQNRATTYLEETK
jgi:ABC-type glycerol-3-phosphate transport system substrate-binding protein